jgi:hypothetical protein
MSAGLANMQKGFRFYHDCPKSINYRERRDILPLDTSESRREYTMSICGRGHRPNSFHVRGEYIAVQID